MLAPGSLAFLDLSVLMYLVFVNCLTFLLIRIDDGRHARAHYRVPAATLILLALMGGAPAAKAAALCQDRAPRAPAFALALNLLLLVQFTGVLALSTGGSQLPPHDHGVALHITVHRAPEAIRPIESAHL